MEGRVSGSAILAKIENAPLRLYNALITLAQLPSASPEQCAELLARVEADRAQLAAWAEHAPMNFRHKLCLVEAEWHRIHGEREQAHALYDEAIALANAHDFLAEEALAYELAGRFFLELELPRVASTYLQSAFKVYRQWEAHTKAEALLQEFPQLQNASPTGVTRGSHRAPQTTRSTSSLTGNPQLDLGSVVKASTAIASEIVLPRLLDTLMHIMSENVGAQRGVFLLRREGALRIEAAWSVNELSTENVEVPRQVIRYVERSQAVLRIDNAVEDERFSSDPYLAERTVLSLLCAPVMHQGALLGVLYLENTVTGHAFSPTSPQLFQMLSGQVAMSLHNALLYESLEDKVAERTREIEHKIATLVRTQSQLVQSEKVASLGQLVAGVAHEINNPTNFTYTGALNLERDLKELQAFLLELVDEPDDPEVAQIFDARFEPLFTNLAAILEGSKRITRIVQSLRTFSRLDEAEHQPTRIVESIRTTLSLIASRYRELVRFETEFLDDPVLECLPAQLNQVFMNITINACHAIERRHHQEDEAPSGRILIRTRVVDDMLEITFADNGCGMSSAVQERIFEPFYTTKDVGQGTGLGLSVSYGIIEQHGGRITVQSAPGGGATFEILLPTAERRLSPQR